MHQDYRSNLKIADQGYWVYDFSLPLLVHHALHFKTARNLRKWLHICPRRQVTTLDTHDGMGIDDVTGLADVSCGRDSASMIPLRNLLGWSRFARV